MPPSRERVEWAATFSRGTPLRGAAGAVPFDRLPDAELFRDRSRGGEERGIGSRGFPSRKNAILDRARRVTTALQFFVAQQVAQD
jgi:hypothetical protein